mmetsp:Transcript_127271/g.254268  ORF Transcript_127271/g.254268 Transcript_127271/m.254268 type:complete len:213 (+) Transcript_127271:531-1169(+)
MGATTFFLMAGNAGGSWPPCAKPARAIKAMAWLSNWRACFVRCKSLVSHNSFWSESTVPRNVMSVPVSTRSASSNNILPTIFCFLINSKTKSLHDTSVPSPNVCRAASVWLSTFSTSSANKGDDDTCIMETKYTFKTVWIFLMLPSTLLFWLVVKPLPRRKQAIDVASSNESTSRSYCLSSCSPGQAVASSSPLFWSRTQEFPLPNLTWTRS